jgi:hypothetical protein
MYGLCYLAPSLLSRSMELPAFPEFVKADLLLSGILLVKVWTFTGT